MRLLSVCLLGFAALWGAAAVAQETYDLIFKNGTLSDLSKDASLVYEKNVQLRERPEDGERKTGKVQLTFAPEDMAELRFRKDGKFRRLGEFPATVGNPIIMYFVETVTRDVAQHAGGSPFYIRNRIKASLLQKAPILDSTASFNGKTVPVKQITLRPFVDDKNRDRMRGYEDLSLTITMSEKVPGWYYSLIAATEPSAGKGPVYSNALKLMPEGSDN